MAVGAAIGAAVVGGALKSRAQKKAGEQAADAQFAAGRSITGQGNEIISSFNPFVEKGEAAFDEISALTGASGVEEETLALQRFSESPGQAFLRQRAEKSLLRNQAAIGGLGGGNIRKALQEQAIGIAAQQQQQRLANLGVVLDVGQRGLTQQAQARQFIGQGKASTLIGAGESTAGATLGIGQTQAQTISNIGGAFGLGS